MALPQEEIDTLLFVGGKTDGDLRLIKIALGEMHGYVPTESTLIRYLDKIDISPRKSLASSRQDPIVQIECSSSRFSNKTLKTMAADLGIYEGNPVRAGRKGDFTYEEYLVGWKDLDLKVVEGSFGSVTRHGATRNPLVGAFGDDPDSL
ncbi:hypothetical protein CMI41_02480 [Candidatus Pacearchaeota archaeon]|nr:hypothetical protein [Candidatus Pacearchaeota archaeon]|tara:strand:- start:11724 stop:12170 length:447 start_codon:yes stop_codon:yes gene_type:complete